MATPTAQQLHERHNYISTGYTCNGSPRGCERERFGGCDYHIASEAKAWWDSLDDQAKAQWLIDSGLLGDAISSVDIGDMYRDFLTEHEACVICKTIKHHSAMIRASDRYDLIFTCSEACFDEYQTGPDPADWS